MGGVGWGAKVGCWERGGLFGRVGKVIEIRIIKIFR